MEYPTIIDAIRAIKSDIAVTIRGTDITWDDGNPTDITQEQIDAKLVELLAEYDATQPLKLLREERNKRLVETDWRFRVDMTPSQEWKDYCEALRDLPSTASPKIENETLTNVTWPTEPE